MKKINIQIILLSLLLGIGACKDEKAVTVPDNWVTLPEGNTLAIGYEGGNLTCPYTLAEGLNAGYVYVINSDSWCNAYIDGGKLQIKVGASNIIETRESVLKLIYDNDHQADVTVTQQAAPPTPVDSIDCSGMPESVFITETIDLNALIIALPEKASNRRLAFTIAEGSEELVSITDGILRGVAKGEAIINVATTDGTGLTAQVELTVIGNILFDRTNWTVTTSVNYGYCPDNATGLPEHMFDGLTTTFFSMVKPGKSFKATDGKTYSTPAGHVPYFIVDMKEEKTFNYYQWGHRSSNTYTYLRIHRVKLYGSHDGTTFTEIVAEVAMSPTAAGIQTYPIPESTYRYVKVEYTYWETTSGSSIQVAEFNLGREL
jgi:hypothetical protein